MSSEAIVCASCPEHLQVEVNTICKNYGIQKAFGKSGDMIDLLKGKDWVPKWQCKVVTAVATKAQTLNVQRAKIICIMGGKHCNEEMAHQPLIIQAIKKEMEDPAFMVKVEWMEFAEFREIYSASNVVGTSNGQTTNAAGKYVEPALDSSQKSALSGKANKPSPGNTLGIQGNNSTNKSSQPVNNAKNSSQPPPIQSKVSEQPTKHENIPQIRISEKQSLSQNIPNSLIRKTI